MNAFQAVALVAIGVVGAVLVAGSLPMFRRPALENRLAPYLGALGPGRSRLLVGDRAPVRGIGAVVDPIVRDLAARLHRALRSHDVDTRLAASGWDRGVDEFRAQQVAWGLGGMAGGLLIGGGLVAGGRAVSPAAIVTATLLFGVGGVLSRERALDRAVARRKAMMLAELPTTLDLVCLAVTAGESLRGALDIVARSGAGPLAEELRGALRAARAGEPLSESLAATARRVDITAFDRFVDAIVAAQERGVPLADALHALAGDVRESRKREVLEAAGRKQVSMLIPVVGLVLPVAIVFAFYPGVVALRLVTR